MISDTKKRVTIKDVALAAGVSTQTVSRVMNKFSYVSEETRQRVENVVQEMGYRPSTLARSLSQQKSYTLGVVTYGLMFIGPSRTLNGVADKADELGYMLLMKELENFSDDNLDAAVDSLLARQVDGILWASPEIGDNHAWVERRLKDIPVPILFLAMGPRENAYSLAIDNHLGGLLATQHLLDIGCRRIGHISGPLSWWEARERKRGWQDALAHAGLDAPESRCVEGKWSSASGERAFQELMDASPDLDAIFVANDQMALSVLREAHRRGLSIPDRLAVVGFDNLAESGYFYPSLTTVFQDLPLLGAQAVQNIVDMIQARQAGQPAAPQSVFLQPSLVVRESSLRV